MTRFFVHFQNSSKCFTSLLSVVFSFDEFFELFSNSSNWRVLFTFVKIRKNRQNASCHCWTMNVSLSYDEIFWTFPKTRFLLTFFVCSSTYFESSSWVRVGAPLGPLADLEEVFKGRDNLVKFRSLVKVPAILVFQWVPKQTLWRIEWKRFTIFWA